MHVVLWDPISAWVISIFFLHGFPGYPSIDCALSPPRPPSPSSSPSPSENEDGATGEELDFDMDVLTRNQRKKTNDLLYGNLPFWNSLNGLWFYLFIFLFIYLVCYVIIFFVWIGVRVTHTKTKNITEYTLYVDLLLTEMELNWNSLPRGLYFSILSTFGFVLFCFL